MSPLPEGEGTATTQRCRITLYYKSKLHAKRGKTANPFFTRIYTRRNCENLPFWQSGKVATAEILISWRGALTLIPFLAAEHTLRTFFPRPPLFLPDST